MSPDNYSNLFDIINRLKNKDISAKDFFLYQLPSQEYLFIASRNWISRHGLAQFVQNSSMDYIFTDDKQIYNLLYFLQKRKSKILSRKKTNIETKDLQENGMDLFKIDQETGDKILDIMNPSFFNNPNTQEYSQESKSPFSSSRNVRENGVKTNKKYPKNLASLIEKFADNVGFRNISPQYSWTAYKNDRPVNKKDSNNLTSIIQKVMDTAELDDMSAQFYTSKQSKKDITLKTRNAEINPFHNAFWRTVFTSWEKPAIQNLVQEDNLKSNTDIEGNIYMRMDEAEQAVDLANNQISQLVSGTHPQKTITGMASLLLDEFYNHGLYIVRKNNEGKFVTYKEKIPSQEYNSIKKVYAKLVDQQLDTIDKNDIFANVDSYFSRKIDHVKENFIPKFGINAKTFQSINGSGHKIKKDMDDTVDSLHNYYQGVHTVFNPKQDKIFTKLSNPFGNSSILLKNADNKSDNYFLPLFKHSLETYVMAKRAGEKMEEEAHHLTVLLNERYKYIKPESNQEYMQSNSQFIHQLNGSLINRPRSKSQTYQTIIQNTHSTVVQQQPAQNSQETGYNQSGKIYRRNIIDSINSSVI